MYSSFLRRVALDLKREAWRERALLYTCWSENAVVAVPLPTWLLLVQKPLGLEFLRCTFRGETTQQHGHSHESDERDWNALECGCWWPAVQCNTHMKMGILALCDASMRITTMFE